MIRWPLLLAVAIVASSTPKALAGQRSPAPSWHDARDITPRLAQPDSLSRDDVLALVRARMALGQHAQARDHVAAFSELLDVGPRRIESLTIVAELELVERRFADAAATFSAAAAHADGRERGVLLARAAEAYERADDRSAAARHYAEAGKDLLDIAPWLAIREARVTDDPVQAFRLLRRATPVAQRLASLARAQIYLAAGDTVRAMDAMERGDEPAEAAKLALASHHHRARELLELAAAAPASASSLWALNELATRFPPASPAEHLRLARGFRGTDTKRALQHARGALALGDSSATVWRTLADLQRDGGDLIQALESYAAAAARGGAASAYERARVLERLGRRQEAQRAMRAFADEHPAASQAPLALYTVAQVVSAQGRSREADSLYAAIADRWPKAEYAGRARLALASRALSRRDTAEAIVWYGDEMAVGGPYRHAARFFAAGLYAARDTAAAKTQWVRLAQEDSIGYYGTMAREIAALPSPRFRAMEAPPPSPWSTETLAQLDLFREIGLEPEGREVLRVAMDRTDVPPHEMLAFAEGLAERGWVVEAVTLGWRVAGARELNDTRVLRVIFPFPYREMIEREAREHDLDPYLLAGLIRQESTFRPAVVSRAGAVGLMQLMPGTAREVAQRGGYDWREDWAKVADANLHLGATHLAALLRRYGAVIPALAAYNAGGTPVARWLRFPEANDPYRFVERIPYVETRGYVRTVLRNQALYRALYAHEAAAPQ